MVAERSQLTVRKLGIGDLGLSLPKGDVDLGLQAPELPVTAPEEPLLPADDEYLSITRALMSDGYAGVILSGPPGTGKTWYARKIALALCGGQASQAEFVQFHPSYQYEDFVQGYVPSKDGFKLEPKIFMRLCEDASDHSARQYVLVIDEFSRADAARVFGEVLTYIEVSKRAMLFSLQSGEQFSVPRNIFIIATMNPWDKGVDDVDVALERRFATLDLLPSSNALRSVLEQTDLDGGVVDGVVAFFEALQRLENEHCHIGHAYFAYLTGPESLERLWKYRLDPHFRRACRTDKALLKRIESMWAQMVGKLVAPVMAAVAEAEVEAPQEIGTAGAEPGEPQL